MEDNAKRTLVKSAPELWELADDLSRMETWMARVMGASERVPVEVVDRRPERLLAWRARGPGAEDARIALELAEKGFGTAVSITARRPAWEARGVGGVLERLLDELGSPERRPFERA
ncbi:MAG TPA: hypothetical protein VE662_06190 [Solirubrobacterales bacterium]|jgi:hypothetical protein|nr:hypothetical protein [Solirubrobacterales bacterium]